MTVALHPPLVSIAIINWNYADFVVDAIQSVKEQTYPHIECVILDNGSTDGSLKKIEAAIADDERFTLYSVPENLGHLGGGLWLLRHLKGELVTFLDADDILLPDFVTYHVQAHLGARHATGFTSSSFLNVDARKVIRTGNSGIIAMRWPLTRRTIVGDDVPRVAGISDSSFQKLRQATRYSPADLRNWGWSQGSSNMFRRSLLERLIPKDLPKAIFGGIDGYFCPLMNAITGSVLINIPLSLYRIHGSNDYTAIEGLFGIRPGTAEGEEQGDRILLLALSFLIADLDRALITIPAERYWGVLDTTASTSKHAHFLQHPVVKELLVQNFYQLCQAFGRRATVHALKSRMRFWDLLAIVIRGNRGLPSWTEIRISLGLSRRYIRRLGQSLRAETTSLRGDA